PRQKPPAGAAAASPVVVPPAAALQGADLGQGEQDHQGQGDRPDGDLGEGDVGGLVDEEHDAQDEAVEAGHDRLVERVAGWRGARVSTTAVPAAATSRKTATSSTIMDGLLRAPHRGPSTPRTGGCGPPWPWGGRAPGWW